MVKKIIGALVLALAIAGCAKLCAIPGVPASLIPGCPSPTATRTPSPLVY